MESKKCTICEQEKTVDQFYRQRKGYYSYCKTCSSQMRKRRHADNKNAANDQARSYYRANRERLIANKIAYNEAHKDQTKVFKRRTHVKHVHGITGSEYEAMKEKQGNRCLICNIKDRLVIDHKHTDADIVTGGRRIHSPDMIRGLLCDACNKGLGFFKDDPDLLLKAAEYLKKFESKALLEI